MCFLTLQGRFLLLSVPKTEAVDHSETLAVNYATLCQKTVDLTSCNCHENCVYRVNLNLGSVILYRPSSSMTIRQVKGSHFFS